VKKDTVKKTEQVNRINYELCVLQTLRDKVRSKEVCFLHLKYGPFSTPGLTTELVTSK
jgi:hypothetical protein